MFKNNSTYKYTLFALLAIFVIWGISQIKETAMIFFGAYVIACSLNPIVDKMSNKIPRALATAIVIIFSLILVLLVFLPVTITTVKEIKSLVSLIPDGVRSLITWINSTQIMGYKLNSFISTDSLSISSGTIAGNILDKSYVITMGILDSVTVILSILMVVFYLILEKKPINQKMMKLFPPKIRDRASEIVTCIETKVGGYVLAQVLSMSTVAFFTFVGLSICHVKYALLLGIIAGILDIIPIVGPTIALILGVSSAAMNGWIWIFPTILIYLSAQWISNQLVRPLVFGKFMQLHPIIVLFSFFIAAQFLGVWGVILAPAIAALVLTLFDELYVKAINEKAKNQDE